MDLVAFKWVFMFKLVLNLYANLTYSMFTHIFHILGAKRTPQRSPSASPEQSPGTLDVFSWLWWLPNEFLCWNQCWTSMQTSNIVCLPIFSHSRSLKYPAEVPGGLGWAIPGQYRCLFMALVAFKWVFMLKLVLNLYANIKYCMFTHIFTFQEPKIPLRGPRKP